MQRKTEYFCSISKHELHFSEVTEKSGCGFHMITLTSPDVADHNKQAFVVTNTGRFCFICGHAGKCLVFIKTTSLSCIPREKSFCKQLKIFVSML